VRALKDVRGCLSEAGLEAVERAPLCGGPAELVESGVNGLVCEPTPEALGGALASLRDDRSVAERMGAAALESAARSSWAQAVSALTAIS